MDYNQAINKDKLSNNAKTAQNSNSNCWVVFADSQVTAKSLAVHLDTLVHLKVLVAATVITMTVSIEYTFGMAKNRGNIYV